MAWLTRFTWLLGDKYTKTNLLVVGLLNSGKTTFMSQVKPPETKMLVVTPTIPQSFRGEKFHFQALTFMAIDLCEVAGFGNPWEDYYKHCHAFIFVVDSTDRYNISEVKRQVNQLLTNPCVADRDLPILFLANKSDRSEAVPPLQLADMLDLKKIQFKPWHVHGCDSLTGDGFNEAFDWLGRQLRLLRPPRLSGAESMTIRSSASGNQ
ncbi:hypothetical protein NP493_619g01000 [Ridgeia piscesae]|uniref:ADP-ribosylation factor-like protein 6 n=1 Tax=Ridgeia piscesae TaxID=27915 RepID=A0AAD9NQQ1_RIDPI|nr:hypothetical protein NP493_619g01000 [Ridgeia piscesae]